jgi:uncharacterized protein (UPF0548 family)
MKNMRRGPLGLHAFDDAGLKQLLNEQSTLDVTYLPVGITDHQPPINGYHFVRGTTQLGEGREIFERGVRCLQEWRVHERVGLSVTSDRPDLEQGSNVVCQMRIVGLNVTIACRVVKIFDDEGQWGFAYGTLPHHVEQGEELFLVERRSDGTVHFSVSAFSRPRHPLVKVGAPVARAVQRVITTRYLRAMKELMTKES